MSYCIRIAAPDQTVLFEAEYPDHREVLLSEVLHRAGIDHDMPCGGRGVCGKCIIRARGCLSPLTDIERAHLSEQQRQSGYRLACVARALGEVTIYYNTHRPNMQGLTDIFFTNLSLSPPDGAEGTGLVVDIGTTTVATYLYSLADGRCLASTCHSNPQRTYGADVISRVDYALHGGLDTLQQLITQAIRNAEEELCRKADSPRPHSRVITGNTAMLHFFTATDPQALAAAPFIIRRNFGETLVRDGQTTYLPRCISAFIGADMTSAILASGMTRQSQRTVLLMDVGTNGEMALWHKGSLICCSTAAGPALEGAGISCGCLAQDGAIDRVEVANREITYHVLGDDQTIPPIGLCGTGLIDAVAALLKTGQLEESGYMDDDASIGACVLTRADIRQVQLAKAAIRAGLETLLHTAGIGYDDLDEVALAGGFGSYLHPESCAEIGLIPRALVGKIRVLGNAAASGAAMMLLSGEQRRIAEQIASIAHVIDLSTHPVFMQRYVDEMYF